MSIELSPQREVERERYRHQIMCYIARTALWPQPEYQPIDIGHDEEYIS